MKTHKQELLDLADDFESADEATIAKFHDDRAPVNRAILPNKYIEWIIDTLREKAKLL